MFLFWFSSGLAIISISALPNLDHRPAAWLDRLVQYQKEKFLKDLNTEIPVQISASLLTRPDGYKDSTAWDFNSVSHLLTLIEKSPGAGEVRNAVRKMLRHSRRLMNRSQSFPSLLKKTLKSLQAPKDSNEKYSDEDNSVDENAVLRITNPVEAQLPSTQISLKLLKKILEIRAVAAREMPSAKNLTMKRITQETTAPAIGDESK